MKVISSAWHRFAGSRTEGFNPDSSGEQHLKLPVLKARAIYKIAAISHLSGAGLMADRARNCLAASRKRQNS